METLTLTKEEAQLLLDGLEGSRDEAVSRNKVKCFLGHRVEEIEMIDNLISKLQEVVSS